MREIRDRPKMSRLDGLRLQRRLTVGVGVGATGAAAFFSVLAATALPGAALASGTPVVASTVNSLPAVSVSADPTSNTPTPAPVATPVATPRPTAVPVAVSGGSHHP